MRIRRLIVASTTLWAACGGEPPEPVKEITSQEVRAFMGVVPGNCWRYRIPSGAASTYANVGIRGPDTISVAGKNLFVRSYRSDSGHEVLEEFFDFDSAPKMELVRTIEGVGTGQVVRTYAGDERPLFSALDRDDAGQLAFADEVFRTTSSPTNMAPESHLWTVLAEDEDALIEKGSMEAMAPAIKLSYQRDTQVATFWLVPGYGFAKFTDFENTSHQVCAACTSETDGGCSEDQCQALNCTP